MSWLPPNCHRLYNYWNIINIMTVCCSAWSVCNNGLICLTFNEQSYTGPKFFLAIHAWARLVKPAKTSCGYLLSGQFPVGARTRMWQSNLSRMSVHQHRALPKNTTGYSKISLTSCLQNLHESQQNCEPVGVPPFGLDTSSVSGLTAQNVPAYCSSCAS